MIPFAFNHCFCIFLPLPTFPKLNPVPSIADNGKIKYTMGTFMTAAYGREKLAYKAFKEMRKKS